MLRNWGSTFIETLRTGRWLSDLRLQRIGLCCAILFPVGFFMEIWLHLHLAPKLISPINFPIGEDFANFWSGSRLALAGHAEKAFDLNAFLEFEHRNLPPFLHFRWYAYPPTALLVFLPFGALPYLTSYTIWVGLGFAACAGLLKRQFSWPAAIVLAACTPASFANAVAGQNGAFTAVLIAASIMLLDEYPLVAALAICLMCFKPHLAILFPVALVAAKRWRVLGFATIGCIVMIAASVGLLGSAAWAEYLHIAPLNRIILEHGGAPGLNATDWTAPPMWYRMPTIFAAARGLGADIWSSYAGQAVSSILAMALVWSAWRSSIDRDIKAAIFILATFAATPYAWDYDLVVLTFAVAWLWKRGERIGFHPYEKTLLGCLMASTLVGPAISLFSHVPVQIILIWTLLFLLVRRVRGEEGRSLAIAHGP